MISHGGCSSVRQMELSSGVVSRLLAVPKRYEGGLRVPAPADRAVSPSFLNARLVWLIALLVAVLHAFMAVTAVNTKSPTFDEPQHLSAGFSYWTMNDFRLDPENGSLTARWAALPLVLSGTKFVPPNDDAWRHADNAGVAHKFFYELGNDPDRMFAQARAMMSIFGIALCLFVYRITREFFGVLGGLIAEILIAFDPNFLAHSALVTSDVAATFLFTVTMWSCWRLFQKISPAKITVATLSLAGLFLTKFSGPIVLPVLALMSALQIFSRQEITIRFGNFRTSITKIRKKFCAISLTWLGLGLGVFFAVWLSFSFRYSALTDNGPSRIVWNNCWSAILSDRTPMQRSIDFARAHRLLPEAYLCGFAYTQKTAQFRPAFLDDQWSLVGFASFFPRAFLYKTPLAVLCLISLAVAAATWRRKKWCTSALLNPFLLFALIYAAFALRTQLNIGHRHLLPIYPALFIGCGSVAVLLQRHRHTIFAAAVGILLSWQIGASLAVRPNYLAYFNEIAGGPSRGYEHLVDSSLDWGQDLPALKSWMDNHRPLVDTKPLYLAYFGTADPNWYGIDANGLFENHSIGDRMIAALHGGVYCISATTLESVYAREIGQWSLDYEQRYLASLAEVERYRATATDPSARVALIANDTVPLTKAIRTLERLRFERLCAFLRHRPADAQIGYSIFIFNLNADEINRALYGPPVELARESRVDGY
jgi:hypothetical protein